MLGVGFVLAQAACGNPFAPEPVQTSSQIVLEVDPEGIFVSTEPVRGSWYAGFGVQCLLPPQGRTDGQVLVGRLAGEQPVLISSTDGMLDSTLPELRYVETSRLERLQEAAANVTLDLTGQLATAFSKAVRTATREPAVVPAPVEPRAQPGEVFEGPLPEGAPLLAWAPEDALAVRFRSVEAAFRFAGLAERLGLELLCRHAESAGKDHETLRLTLHHLLLPSIWNANPGGEKGVSECALIVAPPFRLGRLRAAMVFRVVDHELHDHETRAGIALETSPNHLWRPAGDPFPEERVRTAVRAWVGDCEVVATDQELLDQLLAGPGRDPAEWTQEAVAARHGFPAPTRKRAFTLVRAAGAAVDVRAPRDRARRGARALASRWLGLTVPEPPADAAEATLLDSPWNQVAAIVADTDVDGATVRMATSGARPASRLGEELQTSVRAFAGQALYSCRQNVLDLVPLGIVEPRATDVAERAFVWYGWKPRCPQGGTYSFHPATGVPSCSVDGGIEGKRGRVVTSAPPLTGISDVVVGTTEVTFRLSIDW